MNRFALLLVAFAIPASADDIAMVGPQFVPYCIGKSPCHYQGAMHDELPDIYANTVKLRMVALPSFSPVWAIALDATPQGWRVRYRKTGKFSKPWFEPPLQAAKCDAPIDNALVNSVLHAWTRMLHDVAPFEPQRMGADGITYEYSMREEAGAVGTRAWTPDQDMPAAILADVSFDLVAYCASAPNGVRHGRDVERLNQRLDRFERAILRRPKPTK